MSYKPYTIYNTPEYGECLEEQTAKCQVQIRSRIAHIQDNGYFGDYKQLGDGVSELRWKNGRRVYFAQIPERTILLLLGGNKNGQNKDIHQAKKIYHTHIISDEEA